MLYGGGKMSVRVVPLSILLKSYWNRGDFSSKLLKE